MAYDEDLADRVRVSLQDVTGVSEKKMFGGHAFLVGGHMAVAASGSGGLLLRCDPAADRPPRRARPASTGSRCAVARWTAGCTSTSAAVDTDEQLARWVAVGVDYAETLPPK